MYQLSIINPDLNMMTIRDQLRRDIELHCQCMDDNGIITGTRWFSNTSIVPTNSSSRPYSTGTAPSRLIVASPFTNSDTGTYTCSPDNTFPTVLPRDSITLNAAGMYKTTLYGIIIICVTKRNQLNNHQQNFYGSVFIGSDSL